MSTPKSVLELAKKSSAKMVDIKFVDTFGTWQHFSCPIRELTEEVFSEGFGFDGSKYPRLEKHRGLRHAGHAGSGHGLYRSLLRSPHLVIDLHDCRNRDQRRLHTRPAWSRPAAEKYLASTGVADSAVFGRKRVLHLRQRAVDSKSNGTFYSVDSEEAIWNTGRDEAPNLGNKIRHKEGYFPVGPADTQQEHPDRDVPGMEELGVRIERQHHEVATAGQAEIDYRFDTLVKSADAMMVYKYVVKNIAKKYGKTACFMPKAPLW